MFGLSRRSPFDELFDFQRQIDRALNQAWNELPARSAGWSSPSFRVTSNEDAWRIDVPLPGVDPQHVNLEVAGNTLSIRVEEPGDRQGAPTTRYEQTLTVPQFLDIDRIAAAHRHGMLQLTLPLKESVKPRRVQIEGVSDEQKRITAAA